MTIFIPGRGEPSRRIRRLTICADAWLDLLRSLNAEHWTTAGPIPSDARVVAITTEEVRNSVVLYVESQEFDQVSEASPAPEWDLSLTAHYPERPSDDIRLFRPGEWR